MIETLELSTILQDIADVDKPFTFGRFGDGEWRSILRKHKPGAQNCDGHKFFPAMGIDLRAVLTRKPTYLLGMQNFSMRLYGRPIQQFLDTNGLSDLRWVNADVFHYGAIHGHRKQIVDTVKARKLLIVGPPHLQSLKHSGLPYWDYVGVPKRNCYTRIRDTFREIVAKAEGQKDRLLISISASMPAEILCDMLYMRFGDEHTIVDFGSLWDPLVGKLSRSYMKVQKK